MAAKFAHLQLLLQHTDPAFYRPCYLWLLLELKREFAFFFFFF